jgi:recombinational DNA repair protein (RecF pathway)
MAYETYTTRALVCGVFDRNFADRTYQLFTREAGMLYATARSVRLERSRQRYGLQEFSLIRVSLIRGKQGWLIGSIEPEKNFYQLTVDRIARRSVVELVRLLRRLVQGEIEDQALFDETLQALFVLTKNISQRSFVELVIRTRLLVMLGYVDAGRVPKSILFSSLEEVATYCDEKTEKTLQNTCDQALSVSHL